jgi:hypothetical protein
MSCPKEKKRHRAMLDVFQDLYGPLDERVKILESKGTKLERIKALARRVLDSCDLGHCNTSYNLLEEINDEV